MVASSSNYSWHQNGLSSLQWKKKLESYNERFVEQAKKARLIVITHLTFYTGSISVLFALANMPLLSFFSGITLFCYTAYFTYSQNNAEFTKKTTYPVVVVALINFLVATFLFPNGFSSICAFVPYCLTSMYFAKVHDHACIQQHFTFIVQELSNETNDKIFVYKKNSPGADMPYSAAFIADIKKYQKTFSFEDFPTLSIVKVEPESRLEKGVVDAKIFRSSIFPWIYWQEEMSAWLAFIET